MNTSSLIKRSYLQDELYARLQVEPGLFDFIQSHAAHGLWYWDLTQPENEWMNPAFWWTLGYDPAEMPHSPQAWQHIIFEDDLHRVEFAVEKHLSNPDQPFDQVIRFRHREGRTVWIRCQGHALVDSTGKPIRMVGGHVDVSQEHLHGEYKANQWIDSSERYTCFWDGQKNQLILNDAAAELIGQEGNNKFQWDQFLGLWTEETQKRLPSSFVFLSSESVVELEWITLDGSSRWLAWHLASGQWQEITLRKKHAESIENARSSFERAITGANLGTWQWDLETNITVYNDRWAEMLGYTLSELGNTTHSTWIDLIHPDDREAPIEALKKCLSGERRFYESKFRMRHKAGHWVWIQDRGAIFSWRPDGRPHQMFGTHQDISHSQRSFDRLQIFISQSPAPLVMLDSELRFIAASDLAIETFQMKGRPMGKSPLFEVFPQESDFWENVCQEVLKGNTKKGDLDPFKGWNGQVVWIRWMVKPWFDDEGKIGGILIFAEDQSDRLELAHQLKVSEQTFKSSFESSAVGMALLTKSLHFSEVNPSLEKLLGRTQDQLIQLNLYELFDPVQNKICPRVFEEMKSGLRKYHQEERTIIQPSGEIKSFLMAVAAVTDKNGTPLHFIAQFVDITALKEAEGALEKSVAHLRRLLNASRYVSIIETDLNGYITLFNKGAENLLGYKPEEVIGLVNPLLFHDQEEIEKYRKEMESKAPDFELMTDRSVRLGEEIREWTYIAKDGTRTPVQLHITPVKEGEEVKGYLGVAMDIKRLKQTEKNNLDLLYFTQDQNKRLKNFAHIVSHNLRSHAAGIDMLLTLVGEDSPDIESNSSFQLIKKASQNLMDTITHLSEVVDFNLSDHRNEEATYLRHVVDQSMATLTPLARLHHVELINEVDPTHHLFLTPAYLESIVLNFISNGIKYSRTSDSPSYVRVTSHLTEKKIKLIFEDNGLGIDLSVHHHQLFGMYKTFHERKDARGLGLFMTKNHIEALGGKIDVVSEPGKGSTFHVILPKE